MNYKEILENGKILEVFEDRNGKIDQILIKNCKGALIVHVLTCSQVKL